MPPSPATPEAALELFQSGGEVSAADLAAGLDALRQAAEDGAGQDAMDLIVGNMPTIVAATARCLSSEECDQSFVDAVEATSRLAECLRDGPHAFCSSELAASLIHLLSVPRDGKWQNAADPSQRAAAAQHACAAIARIASQPEGRACVRRGAVPKLLGLLTQQAPAALQAQAATALAACLNSALARIQLRTADLDGLIRLAAAPGGDEGADAITARAKAHLALATALPDAILRSKLLEHKMVANVITILQLPDSDDAPPDFTDLMANAASLVAAVANFEDGRMALQRLDAVPLLVQCLKEPTHTSAQLLSNVALAIENLARSPQIAHLLGPAAALPLLQLLAAEPPEALGPVAARFESADWEAVRQAACSAIVALLPTPALEPLLSDGTAGLKMLASLVCEADTLPPLRAKAADALGLVACSQEGRDAAMEVVQPAIVALAEWLRPARRLEAEAASQTEAASEAEPEECRVEAALHALAALAAHEEVRRLLRSPLGSSAASGDGEGVVSDSGGADEGSGEGGGNNNGAVDNAPPPLTGVVKLLGSPSAPLRRAALAAIAAACHGRDAASAEVCVSLGAVQHLVALKAEGEHSAAASMALQAVCTALPSARLWLNSHLPVGVPLGEEFLAVPKDVPLVGAAALRSMQPEGEAAAIFHVSGADAALESLKARALLVGAASAADTVRGLAVLVSDRMGGSVPYEEYESFDGAAQAASLCKAAASRVLPLGSLTRGGARARAVLFKALADSCGLDCGLSLGRCVNGAHAHHAWASVVVDSRVAIVDLLHNPGELLPDGSDAARRYQRVWEHAFSSLAASRATPFEVRLPVAA